MRRDADAHGERRRGRVAGGPGLLHLRTSARWPKVYSSLCSSTLSDRGRASPRWRSVSDRGRASRAPADGVSRRKRRVTIDLFEVARRRPNVYLDIAVSLAGYGSLERLVEELGSER